MRPTSPAVLAGVALGGALGALARYGIGELLAGDAGAFAWSTFVVNVVGCALVGVLVVVLVARPGVGSDLLRPFLVTGFLGGFTTFSAYALDVRAIVADGSFPVAMVYLFGTLLAALLAVSAGQRVGRRLVDGPRSVGVAARGDDR